MSNEIEKASKLEIAADLITGIGGIGLAGLGIGMGTIGLVTGTITLEAMGAGVAVTGGGIAFESFLELLNATEGIFNRHQNRSVTEL
jgi:hypothetical protein